MRKINRIIIHCTDSEFGDARLVTDLHTGRENPLVPIAWPSGTDVYYQKPFLKIGYHYLILNGFIKQGEYRADLDGCIETGRCEEEEGAHCYGQNQDSLGVCLVGKRLFSARQLYSALPTLLNRLCEKHSLCWRDIYAHYEFSQVKTCPNIDIELIRKILAACYGAEEATDSVPWREVCPDFNASLALQGARHKESLTQKELAQLVGISQMCISEMEHGKRPIDKEMAKRLAKVLHVDYRVFL